MNQLQRVITCAVAAPVSLCSAFATPSARAADTNRPNATAIVARADKHQRGETGYAEFTMKVVRPDWSREVSLKSWSKGRDLSLVFVTAPARDQGTTFLKRGNEVWNWVPSIERVIKIPPSMMMQSWLGSDFTNDDLVKESSVVDDYTHAVMGDSTIAGRACWEIRLIPKPDAAVVWGRVVMWITKEDDMELRIEYFDEDETLINVMSMSDVRTIGGRLLPTVMEMRPVAKPGHKTVLTYEKATFDDPIADSFFSEQNMKRVR